MRTVVVTALVTGLTLLAAPGRAQEQAEALKIIDKAIKATGDEAKLNKLAASTWKMKGTFYGMGAEIPYTGEVALQLPDKQRMTLEFDAGGQKLSFVMIYNNGKGWMKIGDQVMEMDEDRVGEQKEGLYASQISRLVTLKDKAFTLKPLGESKVDKQTVVGVKVSSKDHRDVNLYFDKETGLLAKSEMKVKDDGGQEVNQESVYTAYKETDGLKHPTKVTIKRDGMMYIEGENSDWKPAEKLDDNQFAEPKQ